MIGNGAYQLNLLIDMILASTLTMDQFHIYTTPIE